MPEPQKPSADAPKVVAPRNQVNRHGLLKNSQGARLQSENPDYVIKCFSTDPRHPSYLGRKMEEHEVGSPRGGYAMAPGWEPLQRAVDPKAKRLELRDDEGKGLDTVVRYGRQVVCRMRKEDYERTYGATERAYQKEIETSYYAPEKARFAGDGYRGEASIAAAVAPDGREASGMVGAMKNMITQG